MPVLAMWDLEALSREWDHLVLRDAVRRLERKPNEMLQEKVAEWGRASGLQRFLRDLVSCGQAQVDVAVAARLLRERGAGIKAAL